MLRWSNPNNYTLIDDFLGEWDYRNLIAHLSVAPLRYGAKSNSETDPWGHLSWKPYHDRRQNLADISNRVIAGGGPIAGAWREVKARIDELQPEGADFKLIRCYVNAYTYGMDGYFHTDSHREDELTAILYVCDRWWADWGGETIVGYDGPAIMPRPNRLLIIPSNVQHCARGVSRKCAEARMVLVFKCRLQRDAGFEKLSKFLVQRGACDVDHQQGSLHDHLVRVYALLREHGLGDSVCFGGGLHSVYGTSAFQRKLVDPSAAERSGIAGWFGQDAESLAYMFSVLDRPATLNDPKFLERDKYLLKMRYDQNVEVKEVMLRQLQMIECANLLDQGSIKRWSTLEREWKDAA